MNNDPDDAAPGRAEEATQDQEFPALESLQGNESLRRLRDRVSKAAEELERLRQENDALQTRVHELEEEAGRDADSTVVAIDEDPEDVREKVNEFIEIIDEYLESDQT